jgi:acyl-CoA synthetase (AMP-forming)/AMP-acid ligase II
MEYVPKFPDYPPTLPNALADVARRHDAREFLVDGDRRWTYRQAERDSAQLARALLALGIGKGTRVAIVLPDCADWVLAWFAAGRIGALTIPLSTFFQAKELEWALKEADIDTLIVGATILGRDFVERIERAVPGLAKQASTSLFVASHPYLRRIVVWDGCDRPWAIQGRAALEQFAREHPEIDDAFLASIEAQVAPSDLLIGICTSGSTAAPKIVIHTHASMLRACHFYRETYLGMRHDERSYAGMPLFWLGGFNCNLMPGMFEGACMVFSPSPRTEDVLEVVLREKVTRVMMWPQQYKPLSDLATERSVDIAHTMASLNYNGLDGKPIPPERRILGLLGMTESFGPHGYGRFDEVIPERNGACSGAAVKGIERRIIDPQTGQTLPPGRQGELCIRGWSLMEGYYKRERSEIFDADGWFHTGDTCELNAEGYIYFRGRLSDMIKTTGANVSPIEVERLMATYPGVAEAIVVGLPDKERGERVVAVVVPKLGENVDPDALRQRMQQDISSYKVPKQIVLMTYDEVPRTTSAKVQKHAVKALLEKRFGS